MAVDPHGEKMEEFLGKLHVVLRFLSSKDPTISSVIVL